MPYVEPSSDMQETGGAPTEVPAETEDMPTGTVANIGGETEVPTILEGDVAYSEDPDIENMILGYMPLASEDESVTESSESHEP